MSHAKKLILPNRNVVIGNRSDRISQLIDHVRVLHGFASNDSYFTIAQRSIDFSQLVMGTDGQVQTEYRWVEKSYTLQQFIQYAEREWGMRSFEDLYCTPNRSFIPRRGMQYIKELGWVFADLDWTPKHRWTFEEIVELLSEEVFDRRRLPVPNFFLQTRHCSLFWQTDVTSFACRDQMTDAIEKWDAVMAYIGETLRPYGFDFAATDCSRVFRLAGSIHGKTGQNVKLHWIHDDRLALNDWMQEFDIKYVPFRVRKLVEQQKRAEKKSRQLKLAIDSENELVSTDLDQAKSAELFNFPRRNEYTLVKQRISDLFRLHQIRSDRGATQGIRRRVSVFLVCYWSLCLGMSEAEAIGQAEQLNQSFRIPLKKGEFEANCRYAAEVAMSDPMEPERRRYDYKYAAKLAIKNVTLVEWLAIDESEQSHMKTILNKQEKLKRLTDKRRKAGVKPREEYLGTSKDKKAQAIRLRQEGMTVAQIANQLGTSERTVKRYCNS